MIRSVLSLFRIKLPAGAGRLVRDISGNTLALLAAAIPPLVLMIGGSVDMGRAYLVQSRLQYACDASVLAARKKLGSSMAESEGYTDAVAEHGETMFNANFRKGTYGTENSKIQLALEADYSVSGDAKVDMPVSLMRIAGFDTIPIESTCSAQLNMSNTDIMFVLDTTSSMLQQNPGDDKSRIEILRERLSSFYDQIESNKGPGIRIRYGFVPYSTNVNVGSTLMSDWMVKEWTYQSRTPEDSGEDEPVDTEGGYKSEESDWSGTYSVERSSGKTCPANTYTKKITDPVDVSSDPHVYYVWVIENGSIFKCSEEDGTFVIDEEIFDDKRKKITYTFVETGSETVDIVQFDYHPRKFDVSVATASNGDQPTLPGSWMGAYIYSHQYSTGFEYAGCIEERDTYKIDDYSNIDFTRALDLNIDMVPDPSNPSTQWRPIFEGLTFARSLDWGERGEFTPAPVLDTRSRFVQPHWIGEISACPSPARKLAEKTKPQFENYINNLEMKGQTYHDIGMIWGGRFLSPTGIFAKENADTGTSGTARHLIFLTDGKTEPYDLAHGAYGIEPLDQRRWNMDSSDTLTEVVENRFMAACTEVKKRNITVWVIGFGTKITDAMSECASAGRVFEASDSEELEATFTTIADTVGDLRITK